MASPEFMNSGWEDVHFPMPVNADGQGPLDDDDPEVDHSECFACGEIWPCSIT